VYAQTDHGEIDCRWRRERLIAELDGGGAHGTRAAFERDRALVVAGWRVVRVTWRQLHDDPAALAVEFRALLGKYP
jgi:very-short-patch-repair endonuclease